ncbi:MAG: 3-deoxy-7-phosphoheptulonate synthase, partial [Gammaproteobacteria bacterium]
SQIHRELTSGLSMPVGFKNGTDGNIQIAVDAIHSALNAHHFLGVTKDGLSAIVSTKGNNDCHIILRGAKDTTNYDTLTINNVATTLHADRMNYRVMIDCSHGNSRRDYRRQGGVVNSICEELISGSTLVCGVMLESHLKAGQQKLEVGKPLVYGQSITDACISWQETLSILNRLSTAVRKRRYHLRGKNA